MTSHRHRKLVADIQLLTHDVVDLPARLTNARRTELEDVVAELSKSVASLDPVRQPQAVFDPSDSGLFGVFAAIALLGQDAQPLSNVTIDKIYGSGVYALYYIGSEQIYSPIRGTETPIYVGKANPPSGARTPKKQGTKLSKRLMEHRTNINRAINLSLDDFHCRRLVIASGWQIAAEDALINLFKPIWNKQINILEGFGKHGDDAETRTNKRSPWDTLHPGRVWAGNSLLEDAKTVATIESQVAEHFENNSPFTDAQAIIHELIAQVGIQEM
ncbi:Eco29kI family restriction endonuclease [Nocardia sp. NPDC051052]|uniref:Eco29kI family restriction endonuclease n=1 Tax=Nocardia sp. NPDC051052 TaxID=3364322 RepID=UPI0037936FE5